jgi:cytochrome c-type biogenesis protein CcmH
MLFWILAITVTAIASATLYYASLGRPVNATSGEAPGTELATTVHYRKQLSEIEADIRIGRLSTTEGLAAKGELAREVLRLQKEQSDAPKAPVSKDRQLLPLAILGVAVLALGTYTHLGSPQLPSEPLAGREDVAAQNMDLGDALTRIETQLAKTPDDIRGWTVIAPVYMQMGRYADAAKARRRILELSAPTADTETDLAEALLAASNGDATGEPLTLLKSAAARDPAHVRSRFYLASEAMRTKAFADAIPQWKALIAMGKPEDTWLSIAKTELATAEAEVSGKPLPSADKVAAEQQKAIRGMVEGLSARLNAAGGTIEEWTQLVRSQIVLKDIAAAQAAYDKARLAYPAAFDRGDLDAVAVSGGLKLDGTKP